MNEDTLCLCMAVEAHKQEPERYRWCAGMLWGFWPACPDHGGCFTAPVWTRQHGQVKYEPATADTAPVELEA